jgi:hypothetical protein
VWQRPRWLPPFGALRLLGHAEKDWTSRPSAGRAILARLAAHGARLPPVSSGVLIARWGVAGSSRWRVAPASPPRLSEREVIGGAPAALKPSAYTYSEQVSPGAIAVEPAMCNSLFDPTRASLWFDDPEGTYVQPGDMRRLEKKLGESALMKCATCIHPRGTAGLGLGVATALVTDVGGATPVALGLPPEVGPQLAIVRTMARASTTGDSRRRSDLRVAGNIFLHARVPWRCEISQCLRSSISFDKRPDRLTRRASSGLLSPFRSRP